jgi:hypothetical protein
MIDPENLSTLLNFFDMGASTAENDPLLESAKIETQEFSDLYYYDRIDIIKGIKGSGKTAIYRLFNILKNYLQENKKIFCIFGIEPTGDPIFRYYQNEFAEFSEIEFENFWNIYFVSLIYNAIYTNDTLKLVLKADLSEIEKIVSELGLKISKNGISIKESIGIIQKIFGNKSLKIGISSEIDPASASITSITPLIELNPIQKEDISKKPLYVANFRERLSEILENHGIRIWLMFDRLDEVFPHRSEVEKKGLRGLLKTSYNISNPNLRIKIFLREDIIGYLAADGFTALTHVTDRCSSTMSWSKDDLIYLIIKRVSFMAYCNDFFQIDKELAGC